MTIAVAIICAVLGIVIGVLFARNGNSQREAAARQANVEMEKEVAVLRSQLSAETAKNAELKENIEKQLEMVKAEASKMLADERAAAETVKQRFSEKIQWLSTQWGDYASINETINERQLKTSNRYDLSGRRINNNHSHKIIIIDSKGKYINKVIKRKMLF